MARNVIGMRYDTPRNRQGKRTGATKPVFVYGGGDKNDGRYVVHVRPGAVGYPRSPNYIENGKLDLQPGEPVIEVAGSHPDEPEVYMATRVVFVARYEPPRQ